MLINGIFLKQLRGEVVRKIAYFSMEIGVDCEMQTYSGGLGILAGDTLKAAADMAVPIIGVTLLSQKGYFTQHLDKDGNQTEEAATWDITRLKPHNNKVKVTIEGRNVHIKAWQYDIIGFGGATVPVIFLDTNLEENSEQDRKITSYLYGGDQRYRLSQEIVLGIGGVRMLKALKHTEINRFHMNEGHAALLALELFKEAAIKTSCPLDDFQHCLDTNMGGIRNNCVFTTHTPVAAGHDKFPYDLVQQLLGDFMPINLLKRIAGEHELNMTVLALNLSHYVNSVAKQHQQISSHLFPGYHISNITNGVHSQSWTCAEFAQLFDKYIPNWRQDSFDLRYALRIPEHLIWETHQKAKQKLIKYLNEKHDAQFDPNVFTIGFARRAAAYKRADMIFHDIERLRKIAGERKIQIVFAGKAHPKDGLGKDIIRKLHWHMGEVKDLIKIVYLENYDICMAKAYVAGVDIWLNTPMRPKEASGTSGMKAAHNGVPHFSILDGWWIEGHMEGMTGWAIGHKPQEDNENYNDTNADAEEMYDKLEHIILPLYYDNRAKWEHVMRNSIAFNASFFNTHRMMQQYVLHAYLL